MVLLTFPLVVGAYGNRTGAYGKAYGCVRELIVEKAVVLLIFLRFTKLAAYGNRTGRT